jgi:dihydrofolate reductase
VLRGDVVAEVSNLKRLVEGEIVVPGSHRLGRTLLEHDLVDELRLVLFPVVLGAGGRFFGETGQRKPVRLIEARKIGEGLVYLAYELVRDA